MQVKITHMGWCNRPIDGIPNYVHTYRGEAANGVIQEFEDDDFVPDGTYELPDKDWTYNEEEDYGEDLVDAYDLFCGSPS
jgi:hypothetical protein